MRFHLCSPQLHLYNVIVGFRDCFAENQTAMCIFRNYVPVTVNDPDFTEDTLIRVPNYT